jgi:hypothetical protein
VTADDGRKPFLHQAGVENRRRHHGRRRKHRRGVR